MNQTYNEIDYEIINPYTISLESQITELKAELEKLKIELQDNREKLTKQSKQFDEWSKLNTILEQETNQKMRKSHECNLNTINESKEKDQKIAELQQTLKKQTEYWEKQLRGKDSFLQQKETELLNLRNERKGSQLKFQMLEVEKRKLEDILSFQKQSHLMVSNRKIQVEESIEKILSEKSQIELAFKLLQGEMQSLKQLNDEQLKQINSDCCTLKSQLEEANHQKGILQEDLCSLKSNYAESRKNEQIKFEEKSKELEINHIQLKRDYSELKSEKEKLQEKIRDIEKQLEERDTSRADYAQLKGIHEKLVEEIQQAQQKKFAQDKDNMRFSMKESNYQKLIYSLQAQLEEANKVISKNNLNIQKLEEQNDVLRRGINQIEGSNAIVVAELETSRAQLETSKVQLETSKAQLQDLLAELSYMKNSNDQLTSDLIKQSDEYLRHMQEEKAQAKKCLVDLKQKIDADWQSLEGEKALLENKYQEFELNREQLEELQAKLEWEREEEEKLKEAQCNIEPAISQFEAQKQELDQQRAEFENEKIEFKNQSQNLQVEQANLQNQISQLNYRQQELDNQRARIDWERGELNHGKAELQSERLRLEQMKWELEERERTKQEHTQQIQDQPLLSYDTIMQELKAQKEELEQKLTENASLINEKSNQIKILQQEKSTLEFEKAQRDKMDDQFKQEQKKVNEKIKFLDELIQFQEDQNLLLVQQNQQSLIQQAQ